MKTRIALLGCVLAMGCAVEAAPDEGAALESSAEELKAGAYHGGGGLVLSNTPYGDCLTDCSQQKQACENRNAQNIDDEYELMEPCDLYYSMCKADCKRAFPE